MLDCFFKKDCGAVVSSQPPDNAYLADLNPAQRTAATAGDGPILIIAGAGTGKTKTLAARVAYLIDQGVPPGKILLLTFTRRASAEMLSRASRMLPAKHGSAVSSQVWGGTFHAVANRLLRTYGRAVGLAPEFTVLDQSDAEDLIALIRNDLGFAKSKRRFPRKQTILAIYSRMVNSRKKLDEVLEKEFPWCAEDAEGIKQIIKAYTQRKRAGNVLDYDDLLLFWHALIMSGTPGAANIADHFDHILVDEYQDTNAVQAEILQAMRARKKNIMVVGDDAQSIYSFRAATIRNILDFPRLFRTAEGGEAEVIKLEQNYRSTQQILDASNALMGHATVRYTKNLFTDKQAGDKPELITVIDEAEQCGEVCGRILDARERNIPLKRQAVLFRAAHHSDQLEVELTRRNIPFVKYGGLKFVEAAHVKDMIAMLRLLENPADEVAWFRVLQLLTGIGPGTARHIVDALQVHTLTPATLGKALQGIGAPPAAKAEFESLRTALSDCLQGGGTGAGLSPAAAIERIRLFYDPIFHRVYENPNIRLRDLENLGQIASGYKSRTAFLTDLTLDPPTSTSDLAGPPLLDDDYLILSTIHSAKGCEWDAVHILHVADGMIPSDMSTGDADEIEEERRLIYVAMTRAKSQLHLYFPLRYYRSRHGRSDAHAYAQLSRFLSDDVVLLCTRTVAPGAKELETPSMGGGAASRQSAAKTVDNMLNDLLG
jgi:DNA helicase-2/ATP-dependent DNA helicase PcrA